MNRKLVEQSWNTLADYDESIGRRFYELLTQKYPQYLATLTEGPLKVQSESMPFILEMVTWMEPQSDDVPPFMVELARLYRDQGIELEDFDRFREVMLEVLNEYGSQYVSDWSEDYLEAWNDAFEIQVIPALLSCMEKAA
jgi:hemoglobin-like flavoprotein